MAISRNQPRYVLAVGDASDEVAGHDGVALIRRLDHVVLVETSLSMAAELRRAFRPHVHVYDSEKAARAALALFQR